MKQPRRIAERGRGRAWCAALMIVGVVTTLAQNADDASVSASIVRISGSATQGSGIVVAVEPNAAIVLTVYHVVAGVERFDVAFAAAPGMAPAEVTIPRDLIDWQPWDKVYGLAAFRVRGSIPAEVRAAMLDAGPQLQRGDPLVYWGFPSRSTTLRRINAALSAPQGTNFVMDRYLGEGASGGAIVKDGRVVGIAAARDEQATYGVRSDIGVIALNGWNVVPGSSGRSAAPAPSATKPPRDVFIPVRSAATESAAASVTKPTGNVFRDCPDCPEMVIIPAGSFTMGSATDDDERDSAEGPTRAVNVPSFAMGRFEVTRAEFQAYASDVGPKIAGCQYWNGKAYLTDGRRSWQLPGFAQTPSDPVLCVSWDDAKAFAKWLSARTKRVYRLPSEAEWEYAARANTTTRRFWGDNPADACRYANAADQTAKSSPIWLFADSVHACLDGFTQTAPVGRFRPNAFGLHDMLGNVWEWTEDCWNDNYIGAPTNGGAWASGNCDLRVLRGGAWVASPQDVRSAFRGRNRATNRLDEAGFRLAATLP